MVNEDPLFSWSEIPAVELLNGICRKIAISGEKRINAL